MASRCGRIFNGSSISSVKSVFSSLNPSSLPRSTATSFTRPSLNSVPAPAPLRRFSLSRSPVELGAMSSMLPLHSAVATARMTSCLSTSSRSCRALSQGT